MAQCTLPKRTLEFLEEQMEVAHADPQLRPRYQKAAARVVYHASDGRFTLQELEDAAYNSARRKRRRLRSSARSVCSQVCCLDHSDRLFSTG